MIARIHTVVDWCEMRWTFDVNVLETETVLEPTWMTDARVVSCVDAKGVGVEKDVWTAYLQDPVAGVQLRLEVEQTLKQGLEKLLGRG